MRSQEGVEFPLGWLCAHHGQREELEWNATFASVRLFKTGLERAGAPPQTPVSVKPRALASVAAPSSAAACRCACSATACSGRSGRRGFDLARLYPDTDRTRAARQPRKWNRPPGES